MRTLLKPFGWLTKEHADYQRVLLKTVLITATAAFALYTVLNFITHFLVQRTGMHGAVINSTASALFFVVLQLYRLTRIDQRTASVLAVVLLMIYLWVFFYIVENRNFGFCWVPILPLLAYLLLDKKSASVLSVLFCCAVLLFVLLFSRAWLPAAFNFMSVLNILGSTICLILGFNYYETSRKMAARQLEAAKRQAEESKDELRLILDSTAEGIYGVDLDGNCTFCNTRCLELLGYEREEELIGKNMHLLIHHYRQDGAPVEEGTCRILSSIVTGKKNHGEDESFTRADGSTIPVEYLSIPKLQEEKITGAVVTFHDITKRRRDEAKVLYMSRHDVLTGLHNRAYFEEWKIKYDREAYYPISVIFVDLNGLKLKNDVFGHAVGDENLKAVARVLKRVSREEDAIARIGGDEFVCLLPNTSAEQARIFMESIREGLAGEASDGFSIGLSMGVDTKLKPAQDLSQVIKNAENEMYREKSLCRKRQNRAILQELMENLCRKIPYEGPHALQTSEWCAKLGTALGWSAAEIRKIRDAGYYHDIGKIALRDELLAAGRELTPMEKSERKQHVSVGYRILGLFESTLDLAETVYYHHENWDGSGYPKGLMAEEIPLPARIVAIAEQYDHLVNPAGYPQLGREGAISQMRELSGVKLDPALTEIFLKLA
jgi:diguanylate cyclase (GGDEF)-like protein/PAS domain S-box-containing protein